MRSFLYRLAGVVLVISAVVGILFSAFGIWGVWTLKPRAEVVLTDTTQIAVDSVDLANDALGEVTQTLEILNEGMQSVNDVKDNLAEMLLSITPVLDRTSEFVGEDLVGVMGGLQGSLDTLESGMQAVQSALSFINLVPFIGNVYSSTSTSMTDGVGEMSGQVTTLSSQLELFQEDLMGTSENLAGIQTDVESFAQTVEEMDLSLQRHLDNINSYQTELTTMRQDILDFRARWLQIIKQVTIGSTVVLSWLAVMMIGLTVFGADLGLHGDMRQKEREKTAARDVMEQELRPQLREELLAELRQELGLLADVTKDFPLPKAFDSDHE